MCAEAPDRVGVQKSTKTQHSQSSLLSAALKKTERRELSKGSVGFQNEVARPQESGWLNVQGPFLEFLQVLAG